MNNSKKVQQSLSKSTSLFPKPSAEGMTSRTQSQNVTQRSNDMSTVHESTYEVVRSPGTTTILDNPVSNEERSSHVSPALPGKAPNWIAG